MFTRHNTTLVVQGPVYPQWTFEYLKTYVQNFDNVIFSTWDTEPIDSDEVPIIKSALPDKVGPGNINCHLKSSLVGCTAVDTPYVIKIRSDMLICEPNDWLDFFSTHYKSNRIFTLGLSRFFPFYTRDHIFAGKKEDMIKLFDIDYMPESDTMSFSKMFPEMHIGASYYARYSEKVQKFLEDPTTYLLMKESDTGAWYVPDGRQEAEEEWNRIGEEYLYPIPKSLKYKWYKYFPENGEYWYDFAARQFGEYWHEDILNRQQG